MASPRYLRNSRRGFEKLSKFGTPPRGALPGGFLPAASVSVLIQTCLGGCLYTSLVSVSARLGDAETFFYAPNGLTPVISSSYTVAT
jgi:hypothetical protein